MKEVMQLSCVASKFFPLLYLSYFGYDSTTELTKLWCAMYAPLIEKNVGITL